MSDRGDARRAKLDAMYREKDEAFRVAHMAPHGPERDRLFAVANNKKTAVDALQKQIGGEAFAQKNRG